MRCPQCSHEDTKVLESRLISEGKSVRRRRSCRQCDHRFTTYEKEEAIVFHIKKKDAHIEPYQREKAFRSIQIACQKRDIPLEQLEFLLQAVERELFDMGERIVSSKRLGYMILQGLHRIDQISYIRFASVYQDFKDPQEFLQILASLQGSHSD